jgi:gliding motility-associated-like protein
MMNLKKLLIVIIVFLLGLGLNGFSQGEYNIWYFGFNAGIDFNGATPVALTNGALNTSEGSSSISDAAGNLLFYTDGLSVWNRNHTLMPNGTGLHGNSSSIQAALIIKQPGTTDIYYVFTTTNNATAYGMKYSIVDMTLNGGLGDVTTKNVPLVTPCGEKLAAVPHTNCTDIWILTHGYNNNTFYAYLLTSTGVNPAITSNVGASHNGGSAGAFNSALGAMKASPDGTQLAVCDQYSGLFEVFDFNAGTGVVSNTLSLSPIYRAFGTEFSPDGSKVYVSERQGSQMWQFDLSAGSAAAIQASKTLITNAGSYNYGALQLANDGKIYLARSAQSSLGVINNPNAAGTACNYVENGFNLAGRTSSEGLPTMAMMYTAPVLTLDDDTICDGQSANLLVNSTSLNTTYLWNTGSTANPYTVSPTTTTTYTVTGSNNGCTDSVSATVYVQASINLVAIASLYSICIGDTSDLSASSSIPGTTFQWNNGLGAGANHSVSPIVNTTYIVTATSPLGCTEIDTIDIVVDTVIIPSITPTNPSICAGDSVSLTVSGGNTYLWSNGMTQGTISVSPSVTTTYSVTATSTSGCTGTASVDVTVEPAVNLNLTASQLQLCMGDSSLLVASSTDPGSSFQWSGGLGTNDSVVVYPAVTTTYVVTGTSSGGCVEIDSITILVDSNVVVQLSPTAAEICRGESVSLTVSGGDTYLWSNGMTQSSITVNPNSTTTYSVTATSNFGCSGSASMTVTVHPGPMAAYSVSPNPAGVNQSVQFDDASVGATTWDWDFGDGNFGSGIDPTHAYNSPGTYDTWLYVEDDFGCRDSTSVRVVINQLFTFFIPNSFSPDGDNINDIFIPKGTNVDEDRYMMRIYDRWGKLVFENTDINEGWDGSINGLSMHEEEMISNVYSYYFHVYERNTDIDYEYRGTVIIVK